MSTSSRRACSAWGCRIEAGRREDAIALLMQVEMSEDAGAATNAWRPGWSGGLRQASRAAGGTTSQPLAEPSHSWGPSWALSTARPSGCPSVIGTVARHTCGWSGSRLTSGIQIPVRSTRFVMLVAPPRDRYRGPLLRSPVAMATRLQREHQWAAAPVPTPDTGLPDPDQSRLRRRRRQAQRPSSTDTRLQDTITGIGRGVASTADVRTSGFWVGSASRKQVVASTTLLG
jgi:hypothetical protein